MLPSNPKNFLREEEEEEKRGDNHHEDYLDNLYHHPLSTFSDQSSSLPSSPCDTFSTTFTHADCFHHHQHLCCHNNNHTKEQEPRTEEDCNNDDDEPLRLHHGSRRKSSHHVHYGWRKATLFLSLLLGVVMVRGDEDMMMMRGSGSGNWERPGTMPKIAHLEVMCGNSHMEVHLAFDKPFNGIVTSKGMYGHSDCVYVTPRIGRSEYKFNIYYDKCGTKPDNHGKFYENTIVVQYDEELIEAWDEAKRLRCEWFNDYEKTATKTSPMVISDLEVVELNFHGDNVDCWMEIQEGKGPWAPPLSSIAPLGSPLTMVIAVKDPSGEFDMRVKDCDASDGQTGRSLPLSDPEGCIVRPKLLGKFTKVKLDDGKATVLSYAFISAFKFPDMLNVHLRCTVEICRHGCPDHCTSSSSSSSPSPSPSPPKKYVENNELLGAASQVAPSSAPSPNNALHQVHHHQDIYNAPVPLQMRPPPPPPATHNHHRQQHNNMLRPQHAPLFGGRPQRAPRPHLHPPPPPPQSHHQHPNNLLRSRPAPPPPQQQTSPSPAPRFNGGGGGSADQTILENMLLKPEPKEESESRSAESRGGDGGGILLKDEEEKEKVAVAESKSDEEDAKQGEGVVKEKREMLMEAQAAPLKGGNPDNEDEGESPQPLSLIANFPKGPRNLDFFPAPQPQQHRRRVRRSVSGPSDVVGVQGTFKVVSQADLAFVLNSNSINSNSSSSSSEDSPSNTQVFKGSRMRDGGEPIYGICLPRVGFGVVFFGLGLSALVAILVAGFLAYAHYTVLHDHHHNESNGSSNNSILHSSPSISCNNPPPPIHTYPFFPMVILRKMW